MAKKVPLEIILNGEERAEFIESGASLLKVLRQEFGDTSPKEGCSQGTCGGCSVIIDGKLKLSCLTLAESCNGAEIETVAGLRSPDGLHPIQEAFLNGFAAQCGFCTPGMIIAAKALLDANPTPTREEIVEAVGGNVCRCTGYAPIIDAVMAASGQAGKIRSGSAS
ncbi:(2Fe-2S)-binding protein [Aestuariivirga sp.]|uniref:(2Fe-2S)-binding protein n=1 Tax=Aestuariivirga sp. TaxID=2650926 RepID=UPI0039E69E37